MYGFVAHYENCSRSRMSSEVASEAQQAHILANMETVDQSQFQHAGMVEEDHGSDNGASPGTSPRGSKNKACKKKRKKSPYYQVKRLRRARVRKEKAAEKAKASELAEFALKSPQADNSIVTAAFSQPTEGNPSNFMETAQDTQTIKLESQIAFPALPLLNQQQHPVQPSVPQMTFQAQAQISAPNLPIHNPYCDPMERERLMDMRPARKFLPPPPPLPPKGQKYPIAMPIPQPGAYGRAVAPPVIAPTQKVFNQLAGMSNTGVPTQPMSQPPSLQKGSPPNSNPNSQPGLPGFTPPNSQPHAQAGQQLSMTSQTVTMNTVQSQVQQPAHAPEIPQPTTPVKRRTRVGAPNSRLRVADLIDQRMMHRERQRRRQIMAMRQALARQQPNIPRPPLRQPMYHQQPMYQQPGYAPQQQASYQQYGQPQQFVQARTYSQVAAYQQPMQQQMPAPLPGFSPQMQQMQQMQVAQQPTQQMMQPQQMMHQETPAPQPVQQQVQSQPAQTQMAMPAPLSDVPPPLAGFAPEREPEKKPAPEANKENRNMIPTNILPDQQILMNLALNLNRQGRG